MTKKKLILIILILTLVAMVIWTILNLLKTESQRPELNDEIGASVVDTIKPGKPLPAFRKIVTRPVIGPVFDGEKIKFFERSTGRLFSMFPDGTREKLISPTQIPDIKNVAWSPNGQKAIIDNYYIDYNTNQTLVVDFINPVWISNNRVAYLCDQGICESDPDGGDKKILLRENIKDIELKFYNNKLYFYSKPGAGKSPVYSLNPLRKESINFYDRIKCSPNYCAIPQKEFNLEDWLKGLAITKDNIYDAYNNLIKKTALDIAELIEFKDYLMMRDKTSGSLYLLKLD